MQDKDLGNPFLNNRLSLSQSSSLLSYGDHNYSVYKILKGNSHLYRSDVRCNSKEMEEKILWKYEKQYYSMDQSGHSLAEEAFEQRALGQKPEKDDFWTRVQPLKTSKMSNPFDLKSLLDELETKSNCSSSAFTQKTFQKQEILSKKTTRKINREEALKLKQKIQTKKQLEIPSKKQPEKFSVLKMYKNKINEEGYGLGTAVTFGKAQSKLSTSKQGLKFEYPQSIYIKEDQYYFVPLS